LDGGSARRKATTYAGQYTTQKNADTHSYIERDSNPQSQCSSGRRPYVPQTMRPLEPAETTYIVSN